MNSKYTKNIFRLIKQCFTLMLLVITMLILQYSHARAACAPNSGTVVDGDTVTCSGVTTDQDNPDGYNPGFIDSLTVNVQAGASVTGTQDGIDITSFTGLTPTVNNSGSITGNGAVAGVGVFFGDGGTLNNLTGGAITGGYDGIWIEFGLGTVTNAGTITGNGALGTGVTLVDGGTLTNQAGGVITGNNGVYVDLVSGAVTNAGTITGTGAEGVYFGTGGTVNNQAGGVITGSTDGVWIQGGAGTVTNAGTITGSASEGVILFSGGSVDNQAGGIITGGGDGVWIQGGSGTVTNAGTITGTNAGTTLFAGGSVTNQTGATISGGVDGVWFAGGATGALTNYGSVTGGTGSAVGADAPAGDVTISNYGMITGNINIGAGANAFNNFAGGVLNAGTALNIGAGNTFSNAGIVSQGVPGTIGTTTVTGNFLQTGTGVLAVDLDMTGNLVDNYNVSGTADLGGTLQVNPINFTSGQGSVTFLSAAGGPTLSGLNLADTPAVDYSLPYISGNNMLFDYNLDFTGSHSVATNANQRGMGQNLNAVFAAGSGDMGAIILQLAGIVDSSTYLASLDRLHGEHYQTQAGVTLRSMKEFSDNLLSCPSRLDGAAVELSDDRCGWTKVISRNADIDSSKSNVGGEERIIGIAGGFEAPMHVRENMRAGVAFSIENSEVETNNSASSEGVRLTAGVKVEKAWDNMEASLGGYAGRVSYDTKRVVNLGNAGTAKGEQDINYGTLVGRLSYATEKGRYLVVPMIDVAATYLSFGDLRERGAGGANLIIEGENQWVYSVTPAVGVMTKLRETETHRINAFLNGGVSFYANNEYKQQARFSGAPGTVSGFSFESSFDDVIGNISGGVELVNADNLSVSLGYDGRLGDTSQSHGGHLRVVVPF